MVLIGEVVPIDYSGHFWKLPPLHRSPMAQLPLISKFGFAVSSLNILTAPLPPSPPITTMHRGSLHSGDVSERPSRSSGVSIWERVCLSFIWVGGVLFVGTGRGMARGVFEN